jgi:hypothetical protein
MSDTSPFVLRLTLFLLTVNKHNPDMRVVLHTPDASSLCWIEFGSEHTTPVHLEANLNERQMFEVMTYGGSFGGLTHTSASLTEALMAALESLQKQLSLNSKSSFIVDRLLHAARAAHHAPNRPTFQDEP